MRKPAVNNAKDHAQVSQRRLLFVINNPLFFLSHRLPIAQKARSFGYDVQVATMQNPLAVRDIVELGFVHHVLPLSTSGSNPLRELHSLFAMYKLFRAVQPDIVHLVTIKPVLYGGIAARLAKVPSVVAAISGLGFVFVARGFKATFIRAVVSVLYRLALHRRGLRVIFQNPDDRAVLLRLGAIDPDQAVLIRGSGVDLISNAYSMEKGGTPVVVMASRLLYDKGIREYVEAARIVKKRGLHARFLLAGAPDEGNPATVSPAELDSWKAEGAVECLGHQKDIARLFSNANLIVLPSSYGEGLPKVLIEAAACGRAVVTTDAPGCRDAIVNGETGLLVPTKNAHALAEAIIRLISNPEERQQMGVAGRKLAEQEFAIERIVEAHLDVYAKMATGVRT